MYEDLFIDAYPLARRAGDVRSAAARQVLAAAGLDREDIAQEVAIAVWLSIRRFDPLRASLPTFVERVSATQFATLVRRVKAKKRTRMDSEAVGVDRVRIRVTVDLRLDVRRSLKTLSLADQKVARLLLHYKPSEVAQVLDCSRASVYRSIERIRAVLERFGLQNY